MKEKLRLHTPMEKTFRADDYILHPGLRNAVEVALALDQPLLLTGAPGTGKTKLAFKVADLLANQDTRFLDYPLIFNTKTTSSARDLFYTYDALAHFQASNIRTESDQQAVDKADYIDLHALGKAIAQSNPGQIKERMFKSTLESQAKSSVVLIDEIDKAPRDFSNDILNEIENYHFEIKEQKNHQVTKGADQQILVIMTSNSEKNLPDAFLRRCVFYHIPFPDDKLLHKIVKSQLGSEKMQQYKYTDEALMAIVSQFDQIRKASTRKQPATAELVSWVKMLGIHQYMEKNENDQKQLVLQNLSILVKTQEDLEAVEKMLKEATAVIRD